MNPTALGTQLSAAVEAHEAGQLDVAEAAYRAILGQDPEHADAWHLLGLVAQSRGELAAAEVSIRRALAIRQEPVFLYNLGNVLRDAGQLVQAVAVYRQALTKRPDDADTRLNLAAVLAATGDVSSAIETLEQLLAMQPAHLDATLNLARLAHVAGDETAAEAHYREALQQDPQCTTAMLELGTLLQEAGEREAARVLYAAALAIEPGLAAAWNNLGTWHHEIGEWDAAHECYRQAQALDPEDADVLNNLGLLMTEQDRPEDAVRCYREALARRPAFPEALKNLGSVLAASGQRDEAERCYRAALELDPGLSEAAFKLAALRGETPATAPADYVARLFDGYAAQYEQHLTDTLKYSVPEQLLSLLTEQGLERNLEILDLGCGTGLSGQVLRSWARRLTGVDLSPRMLELAAQRGCYDSLQQGELVAALSNLSSAVDLAVAADVLVYLGDLAPLLAAAAKAVRIGGRLACSMEALPEGQGYQLRATGRYAHAPDYLEQVAKSTGFDLMARRHATLRVEQGDPVSGWLYILQRR